MRTSEPRRPRKALTPVTLRAATEICKEAYPFNYSECQKFWHLLYTGRRPSLARKSMVTIPGLLPLISWYLCALVVTLSGKRKDVPCPASNFS
jgi:hypothetical protein